MVLTICILIICTYEVLSFMANQIPACSKLSKDARQFYLLSYNENILIIYTTTKVLFPSCSQILQAK
uniref:Uncharacterized protein n=1 Tax=Arundo donax TaxID=35708 RepID=A0A0A9DXJ7_ARUDO